MSLLRNFSEATVFGTIWSHVGIVVELDGEKYMYNFRNFVEHDEFTQKNKTGSQLIHIDKISNYQGIMGWLPCKHAVDYDQKELKQFIGDMADIDWCFDNMELVHTIFSNNTTAKCQYVCTKLVYEVMEILGFKKANLQPTNWYIHKFIEYVNSLNSYEEYPLIINYHPMKQ